jgi:YfiH family protein
MTLHADCLALLILDPVKRAIGAVHAGWRSTVIDVAGETVRTMERAYGSRPADLLCWVGPSIGVDRYQVGREVVDAWNLLSINSECIHERRDGFYFDLKRANSDLLLRSGVAEKNISVSSICTATQGESWFSHRAQGPLTGRFAAIIGISGDGS